MKTVPPALSNPDPLVRIRPVRQFDVDRLYHAVWLSQSRDWVVELVARARQQAVQGRGLGIVVVGDRADDLRAYGQLTLWTRAAEISDLMVVPAYRSHGIGTAMIQYLVRAAREMQAVNAEIGVATSNPRALALYRRLGFVDDRVTMIRVQKDGEEEPVQILSLPLRAFQA